jgi:hypothetical protein
MENNETKKELMQELLMKFKEYSDKELEPNASRQMYYFAAIMVEIAKKTDTQTNELISLTKWIKYLTIIAGIFAFIQILIIIIN